MDDWIRCGGKRSSRLLSIKPWRREGRRTIDGNFDDDTELSSASRGRRSEAEREREREREAGRASKTARTPKRHSLWTRTWAFLRALRPREPSSYNVFRTSLVRTDNKRMRGPPPDRYKIDIKRPSRGSAGELRYRSLCDFPCKLSCSPVIMLIKVMARRAGIMQLSQMKRDDRHRRRPSSCWKPRREPLRQLKVALRG
jgi:hypothetical protein